MSGYPYGGNPPQYPPQYPPQQYPTQYPPPPQQNQMYPQINQVNPMNQPYGTPGFNPAMQPTAPSMSYPGYGQQPTVTPTQTYPAFAQPVEWVPATPASAEMLASKAVVGGYEGHDGSPLWVIRANFEGDLIPGKLAIKHRSAYVAWGGNENSVVHFEVCCAPPERIRWVQSNNGATPPNAVAGGRTSSGEPLFIGRAKEQGSLTPGKVHPSHKNMYISFAGREIPHSVYEVLCTV